MYKKRRRRRTKQKKREKCEGGKKRKERSGKKRRIWTYLWREEREEGLKREGGDLNVLDTLQEVLDIVHSDNSSW